MTWPLAFVLLVLASWRTYVLLAEDTILDTPRDWLVRRFPDKLELFITCPYCAGFWISLAWSAAWIWYDDASWVLLPFVAFAVSGGVALIDHVKEELTGGE